MCSASLLTGSTLVRSQRSGGGGAVLTGAGHSAAGLLRCSPPSHMALSVNRVAVHEAIELKCFSLYSKSLVHSVSLGR